MFQETSDFKLEALFLLAKLNEWHYEGLIKCCAESSCSDLVQLLQRDETRQNFESFSKNYDQFKEQYLVVEPTKVEQNMLLRRDHCEFLMKKLDRHYWDQFIHLFRTELAQKIGEKRFEEICLVPEACRKYEKHKGNLIVSMSIAIFISTIFLFFFWLYVSRSKR